MGVYDRQVANALRVIKQKGKIVQWFKRNPNAGDDPAAPGAGLPPLQFSPSIVMFPNTQLRLQSSLSFVKDTEIPEGAFYALMGAQSFLPELTDWVVDGGKIYTIQPQYGVQTIAPNGQVVLHTIRFVE